MYVNTIYSRVLNKSVLNGLDKSINVFINSCKVQLVQTNIFAEKTTWLFRNFWWITIVQEPHLATVQ